MTEEQRLKLTKSVMNLLDEWQLGPREQIGLLGLNLNTKSRKLISYRCGIPLPEDEEILKRATNLIAIGNALATVFPHSVHSANLWVTTRQVILGNRTPLEIMLEENTNGIECILRALDNTGGW